MKTFQSFRSGLPQKALSSLMGASPSASSAFSGIIHPRKSIKVFNQVCVLAVIDCFYDSISVFWLQSRKWDRLPSRPPVAGLRYPVFFNFIQLYKNNIQDFPQTVRVLWIIVFASRIFGTLYDFYQHEPM